MATQEIKDAIIRGIKKAEEAIENSPILWIKVCNMLIPINKKTGEVVKPVVSDGD
jgi:hypothetical protein